MVRLGQCRGALHLNPQLPCVVEGGHIIDSHFLEAYTLGWDYRLNELHTLKVPY